jgi:hypothetical protein
VMTTAITNFRSRRRTDEIPNFPRKTFFWGKISGSLKSRHFKENREERNCTEITKRKRAWEKKGIPEKVGKKKVEDDWENENQRKN